MHITSHSFSCSFVASIQEAASSFTLAVSVRVVSCVAYTTRAWDLLFPDVYATSLNY